MTGGPLKSDSMPRRGVQSSRVKAARVRPGSFESELAQVFLAQAKLGELPIGQAAMFKFCISAARLHRFVAQSRLCAPRYSGFSNLKAGSTPAAGYSPSQPASGLEGHLQEDGPLVESALPIETASPPVIRQGTNLKFAASQFTAPGHNG